MSHLRLFPSVLMAITVSSALARPPRDILTPTDPAQQQQQQSDHATEQASEQNDQRQRDEAPRNPPMGQMDPIQCWPDGGLVSKLAWIPLLGDKLNPQNEDGAPKMKENFLGLRLDVLAVLPDDDAVRKAIRLRQPLHMVAPLSPIGRALDALAEKVMLSPIEAEVSA